MAALIAVGLVAVVVFLWLRRRHGRRGRLDIAAGFSGTSAYGIGPDSLSQIEMNPLGVAQSSEYAISSLAANRSLPELDSRVDETAYMSTLLSTANDPATYDTGERREDASLNGSYFTRSNVAPTLAGASVAPTPTERPYEALYSRTTDTMRRKHYPRHWLQIERVLGQGEFGRVILASTSDGDTREPYLVAVKMLKEDASEAAARDFLHEAEVMVELKHVHVISLVGVCMPEKPWLIVLEFCEHGDLQSFLQALHRVSQVRVTIAEQCHLAAQAASGLAYIASCGYIHRDVAARNCLIARGTVLKIADFGLSRKMDEQSQTYAMIGPRHLPLRWLAIEALQYGTFTPKSDVWAFGVLLWEIVTFAMEQPYASVPDDAVYTRLLSGYRMAQPAGCSSAQYKLMQRCWDADASRRPTFTELYRALTALAARSATAPRDLGSLLRESSQSFA